MDAYYDRVFKIAMVGDSSVGKTDLCFRLVKEVFTKGTTPTNGVDYFTKIFYINHTPVKAQIWDISGNEHSEVFTKSYVKRISACILVYDISNKKSFESISKWKKYVEKNSETNCVFALVGTKSDLNATREVSWPEAVEYAQKIGVQYFETSALNGKGVEEAFESILTTAYTKECGIKLENEDGFCSCNYGQPQKICNIF